MIQSRRALSKAYRSLGRGLRSLSGGSSFYIPPFSNRNHAGLSHEVFREWQSHPNSFENCTSSDFMYPIFISDDPDAKVEITSLPGQYRWGINRLDELLEYVYVSGGNAKDQVRSMILFGFVGDADESSHTSLHNYNDDEVSEGLADPEVNPVCLALAKLRELNLDLCVGADVCMCSYTAHGHCGVLCPVHGGSEEDRRIHNQPSIDILGRTALAFAQAGAHFVAPSDMMDGRVGAIKEALSTEDHDSIAVFSYAAKYQSSFYGPFRDAAGSAPKNKMSRATYQLPPGSLGLGLRSVERDISEGADMVMVKPGIAYLDVVAAVKEIAGNIPVGVYQVSGEFAMMHHAANAGALDYEAAMKESICGFKRAGADVILSYATPELLRWRVEGRQ